MIFLLVSYLEGMGVLLSLFFVAWLVEKATGYCVCDFVSNWLGRERPLDKSERRLLLLAELESIWRLECASDPEWLV